MSGVAEYLEEWMIAQRWFGGKRRAPRLEVIGGFGLADPTGHAVVRVYFVLDHAEHPLLYQVPLTERVEALAGADDALVATTITEDGTRYVYDGPRDPAFAAAMLRLILDDGAAHETDGPQSSNAGGTIVARGHHAPLAQPLTVRSSRVLGGEQSNTSIVYETVGVDGEPSAPLICKLFRTLHHGDNPDVVLTEVLGLAGSLVAPRPVGHITGEWRDSGAAGGIAMGHLAFAQEFFPGVEDAWRVALRAAENGEDFTAAAGQLGVTTAEMHETLAAALPSEPTTPADVSAIVDGMRERFELAAAEVPQLAAYRTALDQVYRRAAESTWPALQRVHGDFHLGQVLAVPNRGWIVLDFEGEPLRPMAERSRADIPLRDVAGMLRSFDYVAGSIALSDLGDSVKHSAAAWSAAAREAFLDGYSRRSGRDLVDHRAVLDAFEIDKALYEAVYEARNRPDWIAIPTAAVARLLGDRE